MALALLRKADGIIEMNTTNSDSTPVERAPVTSIIVAGANAGSYSVRLNNTTFVIITTAEQLTMQILVRMSVNEVELAVVPTGGIVYLILDQMP
jgi:hypothetical protein